SRDRRLCERNGRKTPTPYRLRPADEKGRPHNDPGRSPLHDRSARRLLGLKTAYPRTEGQMEEGIRPLSDRRALRSVRLLGRRVRRVPIRDRSVMGRTSKDVNKMKPWERCAGRIAPFFDKSALLKVGYRDASSCLVMTPISLSELWEREKANLRRGFRG